MVVDFFIHRPVFATVCALLIILAGAAVIPTLPIAQFPDLAPPQVGVSSFYIGASAQTVESAVTIPLEEQINGAEGMKYITSTSGNDGSSSITATFALTRDPDLATVDIQNRVNTAAGRLPNAVKAIGITVAKSSQNFVFGAGVFSPDARYSTLFMSNCLDVYVRDSLKRIPGVANVLIFGERKYSMRLLLDPVRMAGRGLTAPDVVNALAEQNVEVAAGQVGQQPARQGQQYQISVRAVGRLSEPIQFENVILKTNADGTLVRLRDVGRAELGAEDYSSDLQYNGQDAIGVGFTQLSTANALDVDRSAIAELERLSKRFPPGMHYRLAFDTTDAVGESIRAVVFTVGLAILLVILVIFIFLGDWRTTMIHFIATPVSLIGTFVFVKLLGFSINTLTLFGITLATGLVVDDAIVVIENIERHIAEGEHDSRKAAAAATAEITSAVIATSLVLVGGLQVPSGAWLEYTKAIGKQVSDMLADVPESEGTFSVAGFSFSGRASNQGLIFFPLKPYSQRKGHAHTATAILNRVRPRLFGISGAIVFATLPPAINGLGAFGGFQFVFQYQAAHKLRNLANAAYPPMTPARQ